MLSPRSPRHGVMDFGVVGTKRAVHFAKIEVADRASEATCLSQMARSGAASQLSAAFPRKVGCQKLPPLLLPDISHVLLIGAGIAAKRRGLRGS